MVEERRVKLRAHDVADMDVVASVLQDALVPLSDATFLARERRFVMVVNRFMWERLSASPEAPAEAEAPPAERDGAEATGDASFDEAGARPVNYRINCGVTFDRVRRVTSSGIDLAAKDQLLNLLTIASEPGRITLHFSDGGRIRLEVSDIRCHLEDLGEPWPTWARPEHALDERPEAG